MKWTSAYLVSYTPATTYAMFNNFMGLNQNHNRNWDSNWMHLMDVIQKIESENGDIVFIDGLYAGVKNSNGDLIVGRSRESKIKSAFVAISDYLALKGVPNEYITNL